jgi:hypothetical protein
MIHVGVPQESVLSSALFNYFVSDCPDTKGLTVMFADELTATASAVDLKSIEDTLNCNMATISAWVKKKGLSISAEKSQVTFFLARQTPIQRPSSDLLRGDSPAS